MPDTTFMPASRSPVFFRVFVTVFLLVMILTTAITFILPESYASTARIKVQPDATPTGGQAVYDPHFLQTTFEVIQSQLILAPVIDKLNLNAGWGRKYFGGETLPTAKSLELLKARLELRPVRGTQLIAITVFSDDRKEAAQIANAIGDAYWHYRMVAAGKLDAQSQTSPPMHIEKFGAAGRQQEELEKNLPVLIFNRAEPGLKPVRPNKPLNIALGAVAGIFLGLLAGGVAEFVRSQTGTARRN